MLPPMVNREMVKPEAMPKEARARVAGSNLPVQVKDNARLFQHYPFLTVLMALLPFQYLQDTIGRPREYFLVALQIARSRQGSRPSDCLDTCDFRGQVQYAGFLRNGIGGDFPGFRSSALGNGGGGYPAGQPLGLRP